jgi:hypothetical protein
MAGVGVVGQRADDVVRLPGADADELKRLDRLLQREQPPDLRLNDV